MTLKSKTGSKNMKLQLKIESCGTGYKLVTSTGEEIEGIEEVIFPEREKDGFQSVLVRFTIASGTIHFHPETKLE
jgi:hypothetical protein